MMTSVRIALKRLLGRPEAVSVSEIYDGRSYLDAYALHSDVRAEVDPKGAVGGMREEVGQLQFDFLVAQGLAPQHRMLDIGCGTLRGGRHFIRYLDPERYVGIDISPGVIDEARALVAREGLEAKHPRLLANVRKELKFREFTGETFDFILAQSVFTHLMPEHIEECFAHVGSVMEPRSAFYFTYQFSETHTQPGDKQFHQPITFYEGLADEYGYNLTDCVEQYPHPRGQRMMRLTLS